MKPHGEVRLSTLNTPRPCKQQPRIRVLHQSFGPVHTNQYPNTNVPMHGTLVYTKDSKRNKRKEHMAMEEGGGKRRKK